MFAVTLQDTTPEDKENLLWLTSSGSYHVTWTVESQVGRFWGSLDSGGGGGVGSVGSKGSFLQGCSPPTQCQGRQSLWTEGWGSAPWMGLRYVCRVGIRAGTLLLLWDQHSYSVKSLGLPRWKTPHILLKWTIPFHKGKTEQCSCIPGYDKLKNEVVGLY